MDDPLLVCRFEGLGDLLRDGQRLGDGNRALRNAIRERRPFDKLHHQRGGGACSLQAVYRRDARMIEGGEDLRFALKPYESLGITGDRRWQHLDSDRTLQVGVGGLVDLAHAAHADLGDDFIRAEAGTRSQGHFVWIIGAELQRGSDRSSVTG